MRQHPTGPTACEEASSVNNVPRTPYEHREWWAEQRPDIPYGYCWCGCGEKTPISRKRYEKLMHIPGEPRRWVPQHDKRRTGPEYIVDLNTGCWVWQRAVTRTRQGNEYGQTCCNQVRELAHRLHYEKKYGPIPKGMYIHHKCVEDGYGTTKCVNPDHLEPVSPAENIQRSKHAKLTPEDVREIRLLIAEGFTQLEIAFRYGVYPSAICNINTGKTWANH